MILVTGGTGFIGQALIRHLAGMGYSVRTLLRPSKTTPNLPKNIKIDAVICSLTDQRGLRAAMRDVDMVFHLASTERRGSPSDLGKVDIDGTRAVVEVVNQVEIKRFFYLSHLGADRASGYPLLKAKAIAESYIMRSGVPYTIFRSAVVFGPRDQFTTILSRWIRGSPGLLLLPDNGKSLLQPIWIDDLVNCISLAVENDDMVNQLFSIGGGDYLSFRKIVLILLDTLKIRRAIISISPSYLRILSSLFENRPNSTALSSNWLDYLACDRTTNLDTLPRVFGLLPAQFSRRLTYLQR